MSNAPRHDGRDSERRPREDATDLAGLQGAALIRELRLIQSACNEELREVPRNPRIDAGAGVHRSRTGAPPTERQHIVTRPRPAPRPEPANATKLRPAPRPGSRLAQERPAQIHEFRPPGIRLTESRQQARHAGAAAIPRTEPASERQAADKPQAGRAFANLAAQACYQALRSGYGFLVAPGADADSSDIHGAEWSKRIGRAFDNELRSGLRVLVVGIGLIGGWATLMPLSAAVVVSGTLVVVSNVKNIQHPTGGIVARIPVQDGMHVKEGDLLASLDETQVRANLQMVTKQLDETRVRIARLIAERDGLDDPALPRELTARAGREDVAQLFLTEKALFKARASARQGQKELLQSHVSQLGEEIAGLDAQIKSKAAQLDLIATELRGVQSLYDKQLVPLTRLTALQREAARLDGERGQLVFTIAESKSKISEAQLEITRIDQSFRAEVMKDLRESQDKEAELTERSITAQDQLNRIDIRAPASGVIHQLSLHTIGGVITPAEVLMQIVPDSDDLQIEARLPPNDIDQVHTGQNTLVRLSAFNQRTTPQLTGTVSYVSADSSHDRQSNTAYYTVRVTLPADEIRRLGGLQLVSGMPAEVFLQTGSRTMTSYLLKPITDQLRRMFNER